MFTSSPSETYSVYFFDGFTSARKISGMRGKRRDAKASVYGQIEGLLFLLFTVKGPDFHFRTEGGIYHTHIY